MSIFRDVRIRRLDHIQIAIPKGGEGPGRAFYGGLLGLTEAEKPAALRARGGVWFRGEGVIVHLGVDPRFSPQTKGHPAFTVNDLEEAARELADAGYVVSWDSSIEGLDRFYTSDPFGNRIEFLRDG